MEYIGLFKKIVKSWIFTDPIILKVFIFFLCEAAEKECKIVKFGREIELDVGQLITGRKSLTKALNLSEREARRALKELSNNKVIEVGVSSNLNVITIVKYKEYQGVLKKSVQHDITNHPLLEKPERTLDFDNFWKTYPKKQGKMMATKAWNKISPNEVKKSAIMKGLKAACATEQWTKEGGKFIPMASTWLNQERWEDEYDTRGVQMTKSIKDLPTEL